MDFGQLVEQALQKGQEVLSSEPSTSEESLLRLLVINLGLWDQGIEPVSTEFNRLVGFLSDKNDSAYGDRRWDVRTGMALMIHQMRKARDRGLEERRKSEAAAADGRRAG